MRAMAHSPVRKEVFPDGLAVSLEQHVRPAQLADLLVGALDHAVALTGLLVQHLAACGDLESFLGARFCLDLGHLTLSSPRPIAGRRPKCRRPGVNPPPRRPGWTDGRRAP